MKLPLETIEGTLAAGLVLTVIIVLIIQLIY
jgi:hypothetical protein